MNRRRTTTILVAVGLAVIVGCQKKAPPGSTDSTPADRRETKNAPPNEVRQKQKDVRRKSPLRGKSLSPRSKHVRILPELSLPIARPTSFRNFPMEWFTVDERPAEKVGDVNDALRTAVNRAGFTEIRHYHVQNGFAIATRLEQIDDVGNPLLGKFRFDLDAKPRDRIWKRLFLPKRGRWRMFLIVVSDRDLRSGGKTLSRKEAAALHRQGSKNGLPTAIANLPVTPRHECTAFIYEFSQKAAHEPATHVRESRITPDAHLKPLLHELKPTP